MTAKRYTGCVYAATNTLNGRVYIGKTAQGLAERRWKHISEAKAGGGFVFAKALRKYGEEAFAWAEVFASDDDAALLAAEIEIIARLRAEGVNLYNLADGGQGPSGAIRSAETRAKLSAASAGKPKSEAHRKAIGLARPKTIAPWSEERRAKCAATWAAKKASGESAMTPEQRQKLSEIARENAQKPERRAQLKANGDKGRETQIQLRAARKSPAPIR